MTGTIADALGMQQQLTGVSDSPQLDASLLLCHVLDKPRSYLYAWPERQLDEGQWQLFNTLFARRLMGEPIAHILGYRDFWSLRLAVSADTLIPRPDSECLVEQVLDHYRGHHSGRLLDLGTGTGALALALATELPGWEICALDSHPGAVTLAEANRSRLGLDNVLVMESDWFSALAAGQCFDVIISNPPYIDAADPHLQQGDVRFEPRSALVAGAAGMADLKRIIDHAPLHLTQGGRLYLEHGYQQAAAVRELLHRRGFCNVASFTDYGGRERVSAGLWSDTGS